MATVQTPGGILSGAKPKRVLALGLGVAIVSWVLKYNMPCCPAECRDAYVLYII